MILGKLICGACGFFAYRPWGLLPGLIMGQAIDAGMEVRLRIKQARRYAQNIAVSKLNQAFLRSVFGMLAKLVEVNGGLNLKEKAVVNRITSDVLHFDRKAKQNAVQAFNDAMRSGRTFNSYAIEYSELTHNEPAMISFIFDSLLAVALADGELIPEEKKMLTTAAEIFGIPLNESLTQQETISEKNLDPYEVLGCQRNDSETTIKQQFRRLAADYHPDKILSKDLPEDFIKFANYKFNIIKTAYETIRKEKGFS